MKKNFLVAIISILIILLIGVPVFAAGGLGYAGFFKVGSSMVYTVAEPLIATEGSIMFSLNEKLTAGDQLAEGYVTVKNDGEKTYSVYAYMVSEYVDQPISPYFSISLIDAAGSGNLNISPGQTKKILVKITVPASSPPGKINKPILIFNRSDETNYGYGEKGEEPLIPIIATPEAITPTPR